MIYGEDAPVVLRRCAVTRDDQARAALNDVVTIGTFTVAARRTARALADAGSSTWRYHFTRVPPARRLRGYGAFHSAEIPYVFANMEQPWAFDAVDRSLSNAMRDAWIQFAATGDPNAAGRPAWPPYDREQDTYLEFAESVKARRALFREASDLFEAIARKRETASAR